VRLEGLGKVKKLILLIGLVLQPLRYRLPHLCPVVRGILYIPDGELFHVASLQFLESKSVCTRVGAGAAAAAEAPPSGGHGGAANAAFTAPFGVHTSGGGGGGGGRSSAKRWPWRCSQRSIYSAIRRSFLRCLV
jgi:hypothetical protein